MLDQMDLTNVHRAFQSKAAHYTFFSSAHVTFSRIDHLLDHKVSLGKFMKTEVISNIFSDHNSYEIRNKVQEKNCKKHKQWQLNNMQLNHQWDHGINLEKTNT